MSRTPRIAIIGSCNVDLTVFTDRFPQPGETMFGRRFDLGFGGKGANQAVAAHLCGAEVVMVARVGDDLLGPATVANFTRLGIDATHVRVTPGVASGVAPIFVDDTGQNRIIVVSGANDHLRPADIEAAAPLLQSADAIVLQFEVPLETVAFAVAFARRHGIRCVLNPAPGQRAETGWLSQVDWLVPNETEAEILAGLPVRSVDDAAACARRLLADGARRVVVTLGANGALLATEAMVTHVPGVAVDAVDTTGAGDAFIGCLSVMLAEGVPEVEAVGRANLYAALSTTRVGTQKSFADRAALDAATQRSPGWPR
jgi:ribokinase